VDILLENYDDARKTCMEVLSWLDERLKEKEEGTNQS